MLKRVKPENVLVQIWMFANGTAVIDQVVEVPDITWVVFILP